MNKLVDHTLLKQDGVESEIIKLCNEAKEHNFKSVCVNPTWVKKCSELLKGTEVLVCTVIGFPLGASTKEVKGFETKDAVSNGAGEIDMVINVGKLKNGQFDYVYEDIKSVVNNAGGKTVKVIIETCLLTEAEKIKACEISLLAGANFVKTSTGFSTGGATVEDVKLMKKVVGDKVEVKASGGVRTPEDLKNMIEAGATRIGTSSGIKLLKGENSNTNY